MTFRLTTSRCLPAWTAVHDLLADGRWHPVGDVAQVMADTADLAPRTVQHHLHSASARRWVTRRGNRVRMREDFAQQLTTAGDLP